MKRIALVVAAALAIGLAACGPFDAKAPSGGAETACLPATGLCGADIERLFPAGRLAPLASGPDALPAGCSWVFNETMTPDPGEAILYRALRCNGKTTTLEFSGGARSASLGYGVSGFFESVPTQGEDGSELVRLFPLEGVADPKAMILQIAKGAATEEGAKAAEVAACELTPLADGPADALVVDVNDAYKKANKLGPYDVGPKDEPGYGVYGACGSFGITDAAVFWMIRDGYAWFVDQGQDLPDFDAGSLTRVRKAADGTWAHAG